MISQGILLITEPPPIRAALFFLVPMPGISAIPAAGAAEPLDAGVMDSLSVPLAAAGGAELAPLSAVGGEELDPDDGGVKDVLFEPADGGVKDVLFEPAGESRPAPEVVLFDPADEPEPRVVLFEPADEEALGEESASGNGGVEDTGGDELESGTAGDGELESGAGLEAASPGIRPLRLLGSKPLSFDMSEENIEVSVDMKPPLLGASPELAPPPRRPASIPLRPLPEAIPAPAPGLSAEGGEASLDGGEASLDGVSGCGVDFATPFISFPPFMEP